MNYNNEHLIGSPPKVVEVVQIESQINEIRKTDESDQTKFAIGIKVSVNKLLHYRTGGLLRAYIIRSFLLHYRARITVSSNYYIICWYNHLLTLNCSSKKISAIVASIDLRAPNSIIQMSCT